jgi:hypothetical protein
MVDPQAPLTQRRVRVIMITIADSYRACSRRSWSYLLLVCLLFRAAIPVGFMPGAGGSASLSDWISFCYGNSGSAQLLALARTYEQNLGGHSGHHELSSHEHSLHEHGPHEHSHQHHAAAGHDTGTADQLPLSATDHSYCPVASTLVPGASNDPQPMGSCAISTPALATDARLLAALPFTRPQTRAPPATIHAQA